MPHFFVFVKLGEIVTLKVFGIADHEFKVRFDQLMSGDPPPPQCPIFFLKLGENVISEVFEVAEHESGVRFDQFMSGDTNPRPPKCPNFFLYF